MSLRRITKSFSATRLDPKAGANCSQLDGCNITGNATISPNDRLLNDGFPEQGQIVNGVWVVQFELGDIQYCAERSVYDNSTEIIEKPLL
jgi:hypothetical protein